MADKNNVTGKRHKRSQHNLTGILVICGVTVVLASLASLLSDYSAVEKLIMISGLSWGYMGIVYLLVKPLSQAATSKTDSNYLNDEYNQVFTHLPIGACSFSADGRLFVANQQMSDLFGLQSLGRLEGMQISEVLRAVVAKKAMPLSVLRDQLRAIRDLARNQATGKIQLVLHGNRFVDLHYQPKAGGGAIVMAIETTDHIKSQSMIASAQDELLYVTRHDMLTGLYNQEYFKKCLHDWVDSSKEPGIGLLMINSKNFNKINEIYGHATGNEVVVALGKKLRELAHQDDLVCRFNCATFIIASSQAAMRSTAYRAAQAILQELTEHELLSGKHTPLEIGIGISFIDDEQRDVDQALQNAELALERTRWEPEGQIAFFSRALREQLSKRSQLEIDLRRALDHGELSVAYQPLVERDTYRIIGCEALARWYHPELGAVSPGQFIPAAERLGLIEELSNFVLRQACETCLKWPEHSFVAVNLSSCQLRRHSTVNNVAKILNETGMPTHRLEFEVTESGFLQDIEVSRTILEKYADMGISISLDDFGTGYSSLYYLNKLPISKLKIDRSFIVNMAKSESSVALLRNVTRMASELGLKVVLEGIEKISQMEHIIEELDYFDQLQGFLFVPPLPAMMVQDLLLSTNGRGVIQSKAIAG